MEFRLFSLNELLRDSTITNPINKMECDREMEGSLLTELRKCYYLFLTAHCCLRDTKGTHGQHLPLSKWNMGEGCGGCGGAVWCGKARNGSRRQGISTESLLPRGSRWSHTSGSSPRGHGAASDTPGYSAIPRTFPLSRCCSMAQTRTHESQVSGAGRARKATETKRNDGIKGVRNGPQTGDLEGRCSGPCVRASDT